MWRGTSFFKQIKMKNKLMWASLVVLGITLAIFMWIFTIALKVVFWGVVFATAIYITIKIIKWIIEQRWKWKIKQREKMFLVILPLTMLFISCNREPVVFNYDEEPAIVKKVKAESNGYSTYYFEWQDEKTNNFKISNTGWIVAPNGLAIPYDTIYVTKSKPSINN